MKQYRDSILTKEEYNNMKVMKANQKRGKKKRRK
jgi:hypothetical protein